MGAGRQLPRHHHAGYCLLIPIIIALVALTPLRNAFKLAMDFAASGVLLYGLNAVLNSIISTLIEAEAVPEESWYAIGPWSTCTNGNIALIVLAGMLVVAICCLVAGILMSRKEKGVR